jgi:hypothetical protein
MWFERKLMNGGLDVGTLSRIIQFGETKPKIYLEIEEEDRTFQQVFICSKANPTLIYKTMAKFVESGAAVVVFH